ncbi:hypothetical protein J5N97_011420 [Dioscorea zingiberensis]|uniref:Uncharacterized protein n=1 Tax=Dioscorea zingiberensis TaxID=325984 RepID=A0A9D5D0C4_9LILI|nr:hypothetical protein J5N97_011420 [Dioscorea zingiberensis]
MISILKGLRKGTSIYPADSFPNMKVKLIGSDRNHQSYISEAVFWTHSAPKPVCFEVMIDEKKKEIQYSMWSHASDKSRLSEYGKHSLRNSYSSAEIFLDCGSETAAVTQLPERFDENCGGGFQASAEANKVYM